MLLSDCCNSPPAGGMEEYGICGECREHCEFYDDEEECLGFECVSETCPTHGLKGKRYDEIVRDADKKQENK